MIITKSKDINEIVKLIDKKSVFIMGCSECATICKTGGEEEINKLKRDFILKGIKVTGSVVLDPACHKLNDIRILKKFKNELNKSEKILILSCGNGLQTVSDIFEDKDIICGTNTLFLGEIKHLNEFKRMCNFCGNCIVNNYQGLCPITRCPKNMLNGPCGGSVKGKCEINSDMDCVWQLIVDKFKNKNKINELKKIAEPFDWSKSQNWRLKI
jgi:hypothetical protein